MDYKNIQNHYWVYGLVLKKEGIREKVTNELFENNIETRPLICGSLGQQPFWIKRYGEIKFKNAGLVNDYGFYLPNNHQLTDEEIQLVCKVVNESTRTEDKKW